MRRPKRFWYLPALCLLAGFPSSDSRSELSLDMQDQSVKGILLVNPEDPTPWPSYWSRFRVHVSGDLLLNEEGDLRDDGRPDFLIDPAQGAAEAVWALNEGAAYHIAHSRWSNGSWSDPVLVTSGADDDHDPRLALIDDGGLGVVWWRDGETSQVLYAQRDDPAAPFGSEVLVSNPSLPASHPSMASVTGSVFVAYEQRGASSKTIVVEKKSGAGSFVTEIIAITTRLDELEVEIHQDGGQVWVDWIDSDTHLGWSELTATGWKAPAYESYIDDGLERTRLRIKAAAIH